MRVRCAGRGRERVYRETVPSAATCRPQAAASSRCADLRSRCDDDLSPGLAVSPPRRAPRRRQARAGEHADGDARRPRARLPDGRVRRQARRRQRVVPAARRDARAHDERPRPRRRAAWRELSRLDAGGWHSAKYAGEPLPTLASIARWARAHGVACNIEIKPTPGRERETGAAVALDAATLWRDAEVPPLLSSFSEDALDAARDAVPALPRALLLDDVARRLAGAPRAARLRRARRRPRGARRRASCKTVRAAGLSRALLHAERARRASPSSPRGASTASSPTPSTTSPRIRCRRRRRCR